MINKMLPYTCLILVLICSQIRANNLNRSTHIIGGNDASKGQVPYQISLQRQNGHFCGGAILSFNWIVTAAHCVERYTKSQLRIRYNTLTHNSGGHIVKISEIIIHDKYDGRWTLDSDIALLKTAVDLNLNLPNSKSIRLPNQVSYSNSGNITVSGWGLTSQVNSTFPSHLQVISIPIVNHKKCSEIYDNQLTENMFCAGIIDTGGKDSCQGDSGGPAVQNDTLFGIVSWGQGCALPQLPGVYTQVDKYIDWITSIII